METTLRSMRRGELCARERVSSLALVATQLTLTHEAMTWIAALQDGRSRGAHDQMVCVGWTHRAHIDAACLASPQTDPRDREQRWSSRERARTREQLAP